MTCNGLSRELSAERFGCRWARSTIDAIVRVSRMYYLRQVPHVRHEVGGVAHNVLVIGGVTSRREKAT